MKSFVNLYCVAVLLLSFSIYSSASRRHSARNTNIAIRRRIAKPLVEAFSPRGLRVSIPDLPGMELFAFHGNVNAPMNHLETGALSKDILKPTNGRWVFEDKNVQMRVGDVVNYWIFAQVSSTCHRVDNLSEIIKELIPGENFNEPIRESSVIAPIPCQEPSTPKPQVCPECHCPVSQLDTTSNHQDTLTKMDEINAQLEPLQKEINRLKKLLTEITDDMDIGTKLLLVGQQPPLGNPLEAIRNLITDKLELFDLEEKIINAKRTENGIAFEMSSPLDKKRIILRAKKMLEGSNYKIADPQDPETLVSGQYLLDERLGSMITTRQ